MKLSRSTRFVAAVIALISLLFSQFALASYVCPGTIALGGGMAMVESAHDMASMDHCAGMDREQPSLCDASSHVGQQSLDKPDLPQVPPFHAIGPALTVVVLDRITPAPSSVAIRRFLAHATAPPLAIRHCCFRI